MDRHQQSVNKSNSKPRCRPVILIGRTLIGLLGWYHPPIRAGHLLLLLMLLLLLQLCLQLGEIMEPGMLQSIMRADPHFRTELEHPVQQVETQRVDLGKDETQIRRRIHVEVRLVLGELRDSGPRTLRRRAHQPEDLLELVLVRRSREQRTSGVELRHDTAGRPDINTSVVRATAQEDIRSAVPQGDHFVGEGVDRDAKRPRQSKVTQFQLSLLVDQQVLRFEIAMQDSILMAEGDAFEQLVHKGLDRGLVQLSSIAAGIHVFLQILIHVFEDKHQLVFRVDDIVE